MKFFPIIKFLILILAFYHLLNNDDLNFNELFNNELLEYYNIFIAVFFLISVTYFIGAFRWWLILKSFNFKVQLYEIVKITYIGAFFNNVLFGAYGGDLVKGYYIYKLSKNSLKSTLTILFDRCIGFLGLFLIGFFSSIIIFREEFLLLINIKLILILSLSIIILTSLFYIIILNKKKLFSIKINKYFDYLNLYLRENKMNLFFFIFLSSVLFSIVHFSVYLISDLIFYFELGIKKIFFLNFFTTLVNAIPITPGGLGIGEITFVNINKFIFINESSINNIANVIILYRIINLVVCLPGAVIYIFQKKKL